MFCIDNFHEPLNLNFIFRWNEKYTKYISSEREDKSQTTSNKTVLPLISCSPVVNPARQLRESSFNNLLTLVSWHCKFQQTCACSLTLGCWNIERCLDDSGPPPAKYSSQDHGRGEVVWKIIVVWYYVGFTKIKFSKIFWKLLFTGLSLGSW